MTAIVIRRWRMPAAGAPPTRSRFFHAWDRLAYHYDKAAYWVRTGRRSNASRHLVELRTLTSALAVENDVALLIWASRALIAEVDGDLAEATEATERLVQAMRIVLKEWPECPYVTRLDVVNELDALRAMRLRLA